MRVFVSPHAAEQYVTRFHPGIPLYNATRKVFVLATNARRTTQSGPSGGVVWVAEDAGHGPIELIVKADYVERVWVILTVLPASPGRFRVGEVVIDPDLELRQEADLERAEHAEKMRLSTLGEQGVKDEEAAQAVYADRRAEIALLGPLYFDELSARALIRITKHRRNRAMSALLVMLAYRAGDGTTHKSDTIRRAKECLENIGVVFTP